MRNNDNFFRAQSIENAKNDTVEKIYINEMAYDIIGERELKLELPDGNYTIESDNSQPINVDLNQNKEILLELRPSGLIYIVAFFVFVPLILKFGFSINKIIRGPMKYKETPIFTIDLYNATEAWSF